MPFKHSRTLLLTFSVLCFLFLSGQEKVINIQWLGQYYRVPDKSFSLPTFTGAFHDKDHSFLPTLTVQVPVNVLNGNVSAELIDAQWENIPAEGNITLPADPILNTGIGIARKKGIAVIQVLPLRQVGGSWQRLVSAKLRYSVRQGSQNTQLRGTDEYPESSVLASGNWYKIAVNQAGLYKLDYNFLRSLGMDNIDASTIKIYGHTDGALPELAGDMPYTDALEIPIQVVASGSTLQNGDYVTAYLPGPEKILYNSTTQIFSHVLHPYSFKKYFFITDDGGPGKRVGAIAPPAGAEDMTINSFDDYQYIEQEQRNIGHTGKLWLGDEFGIVDSRSYDFSLPNVVTGTPAQITFSAAAFSLSGSTSFQIDVDGNFLGSLSIAQTPIFSGVVDYGRQGSVRYAWNSPSESMNIALSFQRNGGEAAGWMDFLAVQARRQLRYNGSPLIFRSIQNVGPAKISRFEISNAPASLQVWDVTDPLDVKRVNVSVAGGTASLKVLTDTMRTFVAFDAPVASAEAVGAVANQDLHASGQPDFVIVTRPSLLSQANELAELHRSLQGMEVLVTTFEQVANEFSGGTPDATAIRNLMKMYYDRAAGDEGLEPKYLLLFGDGTYNNRNLGNFYIPTYQSANSVGAIQSYVTDDFFGLLDDNEGADIENTFTKLMDIAVGRIPSENTERANIAIDKIKSYLSPESLGNWMNELCFVADDEDNNIHLDDADGIAQTLATLYPQYNVDKIYMDAYNQQSTASGSRYPDVNEAIAKKLFAGVRVINYLGHGGINGLAKERIVTFDDINSWENPNKYPFFVTATCEFTRYDEEGEFTGGERAFFKENGGASAMLTTTRVVFSNQNELINRNFMFNLLALDQLPDKTLGDAILVAKNVTNTNIGNRKFALIGDPALPLHYPQNKVVTTLINGVPPGPNNDTLKALSRVTIEGRLQTPGGSLLNNFNGTAYIKIFDKPKNYMTLGNDETSIPEPFILQRNVIYNGKARVNGGIFSYTFVVPKDIDLSFGNGKISYYAEDGSESAAGFDNTLYVGGQNDTAAADNTGPDVEVFMESTDWAFGGVTTPDPDLLVELFDENGINASGNGIGHDITAILDEDTRNQIILNDFYEASLDDFRSGNIRYPLTDLSPGRHTLSLKAWDTYNNSGVGYTEFIVEESADLALHHVLNYPNPFTTNTEFSFDQNRPGQPLDVKIEIYTVSGRVIKTIRQSVVSEGYRVSGIFWDGKDEFGDNIGRGVYVYRITVQDGSGQKARQYQKLVVLK